MRASFNCVSDSYLVMGDEGWTEDGIKRCKICLKILGETRKGAEPLCENPCKDKNKHIKNNERARKRRLRITHNWVMARVHPL